MTTNSTPGVEKPDPKTQEQAKKLFSNDKIKNLTKLQIQQYIESFFKDTGQNNDLLSAVSPRFIHYNIDRSFDPKTDPTQRQMQVARYFNELKNVIPTILVWDGGINAAPQSIGQIANSILYEGEWRGYYPINRIIPLVIIAAARDVDEADEMSGLISLMFNELRNLAGGSYITGNQANGETWMLALPNGPVDVGPLGQIDVDGDPIEKIWYTETTLEVFFEDVLAVRQKIDQEVGLGGVIVGNEDDLRRVLQPEIIIPDTISINEQPTVFIKNVQNHYRVILSNAKVATLSCDLRLTPRAFGTVSILVVDNTIPAEDRILAEKEIEIV